MNTNPTPIEAVAPILEQIQILNWERQNLSHGKYLGKDLSALGFPYDIGEWIPTDKRYSAMLEHARAFRTYFYSKK